MVFYLLKYSLGSFLSRGGGGGEGGARKQGKESK